MDAPSDSKIERGLKRIHLRYENFKFVCILAGVIVIFGGIVKWHYPLLVVVPLSVAYYFGIDSCLHFVRDVAKHTWAGFVPASWG